MNQLRPASLRNRRRRSALVIFGALLLSAALLTSVASAQGADPRVGLAPGFETPGVAAHGMRAAREPPQAGGLLRPRELRATSAFVNSDMALQGNFTRSSATSTASRSTTSRTRSSPALSDRGRLPGRPGRPLGLREPALHVGRGERAPGPTADADARGGRDHALPRRPHLRHQQPRRACAGGGGADLPRLAHAHARDEPERRPTTSTSTSQGTAASARRPRCRAAGAADGNTANHAASDERTRRSGGSRSSRSRSRRPRTRRVVNEPRLFRDAATGASTALQNAPPTPLHPVRDTVGRRRRSTDSCHDITVYPEIELAAGACEGNGLLIDISDPANPTRIDAVADPLYAYWHGATFTNDGKKVVFTDEWGGGTGRALPRDRRPQLGRATRSTTSSTASSSFRSYYKLPVVADDPGELRQPHPVARPGPRPRHLRPGLVPGRRVGGRLHRLGQPGRDRLLRPRADQHGHASSSAACGRPTGTTAPSTAPRSPAASTSATHADARQLSQNEIDAAAEVHARAPERPAPARSSGSRASPSSRSFLDQLVRADAIPTNISNNVDKALDKAEMLPRGGQQRCCPGAAPGRNQAAARPAIRQPARRAAGSRGLVLAHGEGRDAASASFPRTPRLVVGSMRAARWEVAGIRPAALIMAQAVTRPRPRHPARTALSSHREPPARPRPQVRRARAAWGDALLHRPDLLAHHACLLGHLPADAALGGLTLGVVLFGLARASPSSGSSSALVLPSVRDLGLVLLLRPGSRTARRSARPPCRTP